MWETRITAGCAEHNLEYPNFREGLSKANVLLNRKTLADLACFEPYSFKALTEIAKQASQDGLAGISKSNTPSGVITRSNIK